MGTRPSDAERQQERDQLKTAAPGSSGGFELKPQHLYYTSAVVRDGQFDYDKGATTLVNALNQYSQSAGTGAGPDAFAKAYMQIAEKFVKVWAASVVSVGGVAVGLTLTANNYQAADWASRGMYGPPPRRTPPAVIDSAPDYGKINDIKWSGTGRDADSWAISGALGEIPDFLAGAIRPAIEYGLNLGKTHEITPGAREDDLKGMAGAWQEAGKTALKSGDNFTSAIEYMTDPHGNNEWQSAMKSFCQSIWGTTPWGQTRDAQGQIAQQGGRSWTTSGTVAPAQRRPILEVLQHTADTMQKTCSDLVQAAQTCRQTTTHLAEQAAKGMVGELTSGNPLEILGLAGPQMFATLVWTFRKHMDREAADKAVEIYQQKFHEAAATLLALEWELDEALKSAPTFAAEEARAEGFGSRSLNDFKNEHKYTVDQDEKNHFYPIDLASDEGLYGGHSIEKHVGLTDDQLRTRLRDDSSASSASSFKDLTSAQRFTQAALDDVDNADRIEKWIERVERRKQNNPGWDPNNSKIQPPIELSFNDVTGSTISGTDYAQNGDRAQASDTHKVRVVLRYRDGLNPPFTVVTSMPVN
ncbi:RNase A-like domain-containing protein [Streptomyces sp. MMG1121]|uniref:RNase A-like domain-containing protein n=1 Tax=Streptomyces sp. MMG1121 TaxID=1415544 RepID=UPI000B2364C8|nr:RNase A-like domain-containing protein [Streptomyces sp. MMG1121]